MKITCYECGKSFHESNGFYIERRITNPGTIPAESETTGYGYCSEQCADRHHILEQDAELQDLGNYEEADASVVVTSLDGSLRGEVLRVQDLKSPKK
ncbi:hypothetical protein CSA56_18055 [candidate division KSB3 bacterium]|uniref:C2H2-type domain-containing protein n=1 Tax=candidate division KSB3 bacterium TaxID=2044937 RepID=A0A2G6K9Q2_9BACT|nr:MAG: hypothetical protein CSA56_18055 [candidate division KSB3 bacterium]